MCFRNTRKAGKALGILLLVVSTVILPATAYAGDSVADEIKDINENIALLSARLKQLEIRAQIAAKEAEIDRLSGAGGTASTDAPVVRGIEGMDGNLRATLVYRGGLSQTVIRGDTILGEWRVDKIDVNSVSLVRGKEKIRLGFGAVPPPSPPDHLSGAQAILSPR